MSRRNGKVPAAQRAVIDDDGRTLLAASARAWEWVCDEVERRHGWRPCPSSPGATAYRTFAEQVSILEANYDHTPRAGLTVGNGGIRHFAGQTWFRKPTKATAAEPGTSNHGWAKAVDVADLGAKVTDTRYRQFADVATEMAWSNTEGLTVGELWHWVHDGATVPDGAALAPHTKRPAMTRTYRRTSEPFTLAEAGHWYQLPVGDADGETHKRPRAALSGVGRSDFDAELRLTLTGLPAGATVQVRYVQMPEGSDVSDVRYAVDELIGTHGDTFARTGCKGTLPKGKRLIVLVRTATAGVKVTRVQSRVDFWRP